MTFTIQSHKADIAHILLITGQALNLASGQIPAKYQPFVAAALAAIQMIVGKLQQNTPVAPVAPPAIK